MCFLQSAVRHSTDTLVTAIDRRSRSLVTFYIEPNSLNPIAMASKVSYFFFLLYLLKYLFWLRWKLWVLTVHWWSFYENTNWWWWAEEAWANPVSPFNSYRVISWTSMIQLLRVCLQFDRALSLCFANLLFFFCPRLISKAMRYWRWSCPTWCAGYSWTRGILSHARTIYADGRRFSAGLLYQLTTKLRRNFNLSATNPESQG